MNAARFAALMMLGGAVYVLVGKVEAAEVVEDENADEPGGWLENAADTITETAAGLMGVEMVSARYARALADPKNAEVIAMINRAEVAQGIPVGLLVRLAWQESRFNPSAINKRSGAQGMFQFMPPTAAEWGVDAFDPVSAANGAAKYLAWLNRRLGSWSLALAAYNWGIGNVIRRGMEAAPKETRDYVAQIGADTGLV